MNQINIYNFLKGWACLWGHKDDHNEIFVKPDTEAIADDWQAVGDDMQFVWQHTPDKLRKGGHGQAKRS